MLRTILKPFYEAIILILIAALAVALVFSAIKSHQILKLEKALAEAATKDVEFVIDTVGIADKISERIVKDTSTREIIYKEAGEKVETIIKQDTVFLNVCVNDKGVAAYNDFASKRTNDDETKQD